jgi:GDP-mannose transporter
LYAPYQSHDHSIPDHQQAYGEVLWFGGRVTGLTLVSFFFMVRWSIPLLATPGVHSPYQVLSSVIAAMADMSTSGDLDGPTSVLIDLPQVTSVMKNLDVGYIWMMFNCATSAAYVNPGISSQQSRHSPCFIGACDA